MKTLALLLALWVTLWLLNRLLAKRGARAIREKKRRTFQTPRESVAVEAADFPQLDHDFYDTTSSFLQQRGYRMMGDYELRPPLGGHRPLFTRRLLSEDGTVCIGLYNYQAAGLLRRLAADFRNLRVIDVSSSLSNGRHVMTSNAYLARHQQNPPMFDVRFFALGTDADTLLASHQARLDAQLRNDPGATVLRSHTMDDIEVWRKEVEALKAAFHQRVGYGPKPGEMRGIAGDMKTFGAARAAEDILRAAKSEPPR